jgi:transcriptional regulator with XRE-family HTH domain
MSTKNQPEGTTYPAIVGQIMAMVREKAGLEQAEVARGVGISQSTWSRIERGESALTVEQLTKAADVLGSSAGEILRQADEAVAGLEDMDVVVQRDRPRGKGAAALAFISVAALGFLIARALSGHRT